MAHAISQFRQPAQASGITEIRFGFNGCHHPFTVSEFMTGNPLYMIYAYPPTIFSKIFS